MEQWPDLFSFVYLFYLFFFFFLDLSIFVFSHWFEVDRVQLRWCHRILWCSHVLLVLDINCCSDCEYCVHLFQRQNKLTYLFQSNVWINVYPQNPLCKLNIYFWMYPATVSSISNQCLGHFYLHIFWWSNFCQKCISPSGYFMNKHFPQVKFHKTVIIACRYWNINATCIMSNDFISKKPQTQQYWLHFNLCKYVATSETLRFTTIPKDITYPDLSGWLLNSDIDLACSYYCNLYIEVWLCKLWNASL